jgi:O-antigen ligase
VAVVLWQPLVGGLVIVLTSQLAELIRNLIPTYRDVFFEGIAAIAMVGIALNAFRQPRNKRWGADLPAVRLLVLFVVALTLSAVFAEDPEAGRAGLREILGVVVLFYLLVCTVTTRRRLELLVATILLSTCISSGLAVASAFKGTRLVAVEDATDEIRQAGGGNDPTMSSHAMLAGTALGALLAVRTRKWRLLGAAAVALGTTGIILSYARSTAIILVALVMWLLYKQRRSRWLPLVIVPVLLVGVAVTAVLPESYWERLFALSDPAEDWTLQRRIGYHVVALDLMRRHPILGVGPGNFPNEYVDPKYRWAPGRTLDPRALHNMYLGIIVESGWIGFACFAALIGAALIGLREARRRIADPELRVFAEATQFAFVGYLIAVATSPAQTAKYTWILIALAVVAGRADALPESLAAIEPAAAPLPRDARPAAGT